MSGFSSSSTGPSSLFQHKTPTGHMKAKRPFILINFILNYLTLSYYLVINNYYEMVERPPGFQLSGGYGGRGRWDQ